MSKMNLFNFNDSNIRVIQLSGEHWFCATDIAKALGYLRPRDAVKLHCKWVNKIKVATKGGVQTLNIIPERDVYRLIMRSKLPESQEFEEWVVGEVLPSIRKLGGYIVASSMAEALRIAADQLEMASEQNRQPATIDSLKSLQVIA